MAIEKRVSDLTLEETLERAATWLGVMTVAASGENTVLGAPGAGKRLVVSAIKIQRNVSNTAETLAYWQWGAGAGVAHHWYSLTNDAAPGEVVFFPIGNRWIGPTNTALLLDLSAANSHLVSVQYVIETV